MMREIFRSWENNEEWYVRVGKRKINLGKPISYGKKTMTFKNPETGESITAYHGVENAGYYIDIL